MGYNLKEIMRNIFLGRSLAEALPKNSRLAPEGDVIIPGHGVNHKEVAKRRAATKRKKRQQKHMRAIARGRRK